MMHNCKEYFENSINMPITCNWINIQFVQISFTTLNYINKFIYWIHFELEQTLTKIAYIQVKVWYNSNLKRFPHHRKGLGCLLLLCLMHVRQTCAWLGIYIMLRCVWHETTLKSNASSHSARFSTIFSKKSANLVFHKNWFELCA